MITTADVGRAERYLLESLNVLSAMRGRGRLFAATVARECPSGEAWWLVNRPGEGWRSTGIRYRSLAEIATQWAVTFGSFDQDEHSVFVSVTPR